MGGDGSQADARRVVVVGHGMVSHRFCERVGELDGDGRLQLVVVAEEPRPAYDRVHLSDFFHTGRADGLALTDADDYRERGIELFLGDPFADAADPAGFRSVVFEDESRGVYQKLLIDAEQGRVVGGILVGDAERFGALHQALREGTPLAGRANELSSVGGVKACTRAGTGCGGCVPVVSKILEQELQRSGAEIDRNLCEHLLHRGRRRRDPRQRGRRRPLAEVRRALHRAREERLVRLRDPDPPRHLALLAAGDDRAVSGGPPRYHRLAIAPPMPPSTSATFARKPSRKPTVRRSGSFT